MINTNGPEHYVSAADTIIRTKKVKTTADTMIRSAYLLLNKASISVADSFCSHLSNNAPTIIIFDEV